MKVPINAHQFHLVCIEKKKNKIISKKEESLKDECASRAHILVLTTLGLGLRHLFYGARSPAESSKKTKYNGVWVM